MKQLFLTLLFMASTNLAFATTPYTIDQAKEDMHAGRYEATIDNLRGLVNQDQRNYEAWFLLGVAHVHEQQSHQAIEAFRQVIAIRPDLAEPHNNLAAVYNNLGDTNAAVSELEAALEKRPNYTVAEENLADLYVKLALQHYRNALTQSPNPIIEQRYARLVKVRNPMPTEKDAEADTPSQPAATTAVVQKDSPAKAKKSKPIDVTATEPETAAIKPMKPFNASVIQAQPAPASVKTHPKQATITDVLDALEAWRVAWSKQNLESYFAAYANDFNPGSGFDSLSAWKEYKTRVIQNKKYIRVNLEQVEVTFNADKSAATIMMLQRFRSNSFTGDDLKKIRMIHTQHGWKIIDEASIT